MILLLLPLLFSDAAQTAVQSLLLVFRRVLRPREESCRIVKMLQATLQADTIKDLLHYSLVETQIEGNPTENPICSLKSSRTQFVMVVCLTFTTKLTFLGSLSMDESWNKLLGLHRYLIFIVYVKSTYLFWTLEFS